MTYAMRGLRLLFKGRFMSIDIAPQSFQFILRGRSVQSDVAFPSSESCERGNDVRQIRLRALEHQVPIAFDRPHCLPTLPRRGTISQQSLGEADDRMLIDRQVGHQPLAKTQCVAAKPSGKPKAIILPDLIT